MRTLALTVAYDGTDWAGFQRQPGRPTICGALETALGALLQHPVHLAAAGRTDAGVHALGQVISLRTANPLPVERVPWAVNRLLPASIRVRRATERPSDFHARCSARFRRYCYRVQVTRAPDPLRGRFTWQVERVLDVQAMQTACLPLLGRHDFAALCHGGMGTRSTVRTLQHVHVWQGRDALVIDVQANAFLHQMVRLLVANLVQIGWKDRPVRWLADLLAGRNRHAAGQGAPACGLCLMRIGYPILDSASQPEAVGEMTDEMFLG